MSTVTRRIYTQRGGMRLTQEALDWYTREMLKAKLEQDADRWCQEHHAVRGPVKFDVCPPDITDELPLTTVAFRFDYVKRPPKAAREKMAEYLSKPAPITFRSAS